MSNACQTNSWGFPGYGQNIMGRFDNQFDRMANGLENGTMTWGQASKVMGQDCRIDGQMDKDLWKDDGGPLTKHQRHQLNHELNGTSHEIHNYKHPCEGEPVPFDPSGGSRPEEPLVPFNPNTIMRMLPEQQYQF